MLSMLILGKENWMLVRLKVFLGYPEGVKGYTLWCLKIGFKKFIISTYVVFSETEMTYKPKVSGCKFVDNSNANKVGV